LNIANADENLGRYADGLAAYRQALDIHRSLGSALGEADDLANVGTVEDVLGRYAEAREDARQAVALATRLAAPQSLWRAQASAAYADAHLGRRDEALGEYDAALDLIESLRTGLNAGERGGFFGSKLFIYDEYIAYLGELDATFPGKGYDRKALEILERKTARAALDQIGLSAAHHFRGVDPAAVSDEDAAEAALERTEEARSSLLARGRAGPDALAAAERTVAEAKARVASLESTIKAKYPGYYALRHPQPLAAQCGQTPCPTISGFQQTALHPGELMLVYALSDRFAALWLIEHDRLRLVPLAGSAEIGKAVDTLGKHVAGLAQAVNDAARPARLNRDAEGDLPGFAADSYALYRKLVPDAAAAAIARAKGLIVVPSGPLYQLAFETLVTKEPSSATQPHYLIEDLPVSYVPSASLLGVVRASTLNPLRGAARCSHSPIQRSGTLCRRERVAFPAMPRFNSPPHGPRLREAPRPRVRRRRLSSRRFPERKPKPMRCVPRSPLPRRASSPARRPRENGSSRSTRTIGSSPTAISCSRRMRCYPAKFAASPNPRSCWRIQSAATAC
jgi:hypothetical protein